MVTAMVMPSRKAGGGSFEGEEDGARAGRRIGGRIDAAHARRLHRDGLVEIDRHA